MPLMGLRVDHCAHAGRQRVLRTQASMGGRRGRMNDGGGLVIGPGGSSGRGRGGPPPKLIVPTDGPQPRGGSGRQVLDKGWAPEDDKAILLDGAVPRNNTFRPPPGFMTTGAVNPSAEAAMDPQDMLRQLRSRAAPWHQLAKLMPALYAKGVNSVAIDEATGVTPVEQNRWVVAGTVYASLAASGRVLPAVLEYFDGGDGDALLYPFRSLPVDKRATAAEYVAQGSLDVVDCEVLARAMKEWQRRPNEREGFVDSPGDCLAFKYLRDAQECRSPEERESRLTAGLEVADSATARARLRALRDEARAASSAGGATVPDLGSTLTVTRLNPEELCFRPVPVTGDLGAAHSRVLTDAPRASQSGAFGVFRLTGAAAAGASSWVALPQWKSLEMARRPVALSVADCAGDASIAAACRVQTEEDRRRLGGPGLLVVEADVTGAAPESSSYCLVEPSDGGPLTLAAGDGGAALARGARLAGWVLFLARPPVLESLGSPEVLSV